MTVSSLVMQGVQDSRRLPRSLVAALHTPWIRMLGPAFVVSIGYMDPGNWATDLAAGAYGYRLLWVVVAANAIAIVLQLAVSRVTMVSGSNLATLISRRWPHLSFAFWFVFQGAAVATDVSEFSGVVLGVRLLFHCTLLWSVVWGLAIVALVLAVTDRTSKGFEYGLIAAVGCIALGCLYQIPNLHPSWQAVAAGALVPRVPDGGALVLVVGIVGATVMPHNLFLHSSLLERQYVACTREGRERRERFFSRETLVALNLAAVVNGGILIVGACVHDAGGSIERTFAALLSTGNGAAVIFGSALLVSGIAASTTATVSGDYIFAAFSPVRMSPVFRRAITIVPAALCIAAGMNITDLLVWSQVALGCILPVVLVPLVRLLADTRRIDDDRSSGRLLVWAIVASSVCVAFDVVMVVQMTNVWKGNVA